MFDILVYFFLGQIGASNEFDNNQASVMHPSEALCSSPVNTDLCFG